MEDSGGHAVEFETAGAAGTRTQCGGTAALGGQAFAGSKKRAAAKSLDSLPGWKRGFGAAVRKKDLGAEGGKRRC